MKRYKVIQWASGNVGQHALRALIANPMYELVGLWVSSPEKAGRDAGELAGLPPTGIIATNDADALLALDADVVSYMAGADSRPLEAVADWVRILESGKNIVTTSMAALTYPPAADPDMRRALEAACVRGGASLFNSGIDPGFGNDLIPLTLLGVCERVESVRVMEILDYSTYMQAHTLFEIMGFGKPLDETPLLLLPGVLTHAWGGVVRMIADAAGARLDEIREWHERLPAAHDFELNGMGIIARGTQASLRFQLQGMVDGRAAIVIEHVTRTAADQAPDWPRGHGMGSYRIEIAGAPRIACDFHLEGPDGDHNTGGLLASALRVVNAIPAVVAAPPGLLSPLDLPLIVPKGVFG